MLPSCLSFFLHVLACTMTQTLSSLDKWKMSMRLAQRLGLAGLQLVSVSSLLRLTLFACMYHDLVCMHCLVTDSSQEELSMSNHTMCIVMP